MEENDMSLNKNIPKGYFWCKYTYNIVSSNDCDECTIYHCEKKITDKEE